MPKYTLDPIVGVYGFIAIVILLLLSVYVLGKRSPKLANLFGGILCLGVGVAILGYTMSPDEVSLAVKGGAKVTKQEHPVGFYFAVIWNVFATLFSLFVSYWLIRRSIRNSAIPDDAHD